MSKRRDAELHKNGDGKEKEEGGAKRLGGKTHSESLAEWVSLSTSDEEQEDMSTSTTPRKMTN